MVKAKKTTRSKIPLILGIILFILLVITSIYLLTKSTDDSTTTKEQFNTLNSQVIIIKDNFVAKTGLDIKDVSKCYIYKPRHFTLGGGEKYSCRIAYSGVKQLDKTQIIDTINSYIDIIKSDTDVDTVEKLYNSDNQYSSHITLTNPHNINSECNIYFQEKSENELTTTMSCYVDTKGTYLDTIETIE